MELLSDDPLTTSHLLDWTAKWALIKGYLDRGVDIADPKLKLIDLQYADIDPAKSLHHALVRKGRMATLATEEEIREAAKTPPADSRAWFRGAVSARFGEDVIAASWQTMILKYSEGTARLQTNDVDKLTREHVGEIINSAENTDELLAGLAEIGIEPDHYITHHNKTHINKPHQH